MNNQQKNQLETGANEFEVVEYIIKQKADDGSFVDVFFGINAAKVREIIPFPEKITPIPETPDSVLGVFTRRGASIPAIDLSKHLFKTPIQGAQKVIIIAEFSSKKWGFAVNNVHRIHRVTWGDIQPLRTLERYISRASSANGIVVIDGRNIIMLDIEKVVAEVEPDDAFAPTTRKINVEGAPIVVTAEDSALVRKLISQDLEKNGFTIKQFEDGQKAWDYLAAVSRKVQEGEELTKYADIVVTDLEMPQMDGYTLTKKVKTDPNLKALPVIIFSSIVNKDVLHKGQEVGADMQLTKPQLGTLFDAVCKLLDIEGAS